MGIRFRKRIQLLPGVRVNLSKSGTSVTVGAKGASVNIGKKGTYANTGIPGTGIYARERINGGRKTANYKAKKNHSDSEIINENPARFFVLFFSFFLGFMIPLFTDASWWLLIILPAVGIVIASMIPNKKSEESNNAIKKDEPYIQNASNPIAVEEDKTGLSQKAIITTEKKDKTYIPSKQTDLGNDLSDIDMDRIDPLFEDAARLIVIHQQGSTSMIQRKFSISYSRAGHIMDQLEKAGIVGYPDGSKSRQVLCIDETDLEVRLNNLKEQESDTRSVNVDVSREIEETNFYSSYDDGSRLIGLGITLEKEGLFNEVISVYEKAIVPKAPLKHPYERLMILYRKNKDYENEIRVIKEAISVFMTENERRAGRVIEEDDSLYSKVMDALETNESIRYEDGKWAFVQYNVMEYITRLEKAKSLLCKSML